MDDATVVSLEHYEQGYREDAHKQSCSDEEETEFKEDAVCLPPSAC